MTFSYLRTGAFFSLLLLSGCIGTAPQSRAFTQHYDHTGAKLDVASTVEIINQYRISQGKFPLAFNADLAAVAQQTVSTLAQQSTLRAGQSKNGSLEKRLSSAGIVHSAAEEIIAGGYVTFARVFSSWRSTPSQSKVLLDDRLSSFAIATQYSSTTSLGVYWVFIGIGKNGAAVAQ